MGSCWYWTNWPCHCDLTHSHIRRFPKMSCYPKFSFFSRIFHINRPAIGVPPKMGKPPFRSSCTCEWRAMTWHDPKIWRYVWYLRVQYQELEMYGLFRILCICICTGWARTCYFYYIYICIYVYVIYTIFSILDTKNTMMSRTSSASRWKWRLARWPTAWWILCPMPKGTRYRWGPLGKTIGKP